MATLKQDIKKPPAWLPKAFAADQIRLDYSIDSLKLIDQFFDDHSEAGVPKPNGRLAQHWGQLCFLLAPISAKPSSEIGREQFGKPMIRIPKERSMRPAIFPMELKCGRFKGPLKDLKKSRQK